MASRAQPAAFALLRTTNHTLRTTSSSTSIAAPTTFRPLSTLQSRTPSPPPYQFATYPSPSTTHWTRFHTPYSLTSVRRFTRPSAPLLADHSSSSPSSNPPPSAETTQRINGIIEAITELYGTARDEFEMAAEETEKNTTYAAEDRRAAREALDELMKYYDQVVGNERDGEVAREVERRVGGKVREMEAAVKALEESVVEGH